jgi:hypothetical protein
MYTRNPIYTTTNRPNLKDAEKNTTAIKSNIAIINVQQKKHIRKKNKSRDI